MRLFASLAVALGLAIAGCSSTEYDSTWQGGVEAQQLGQFRYVITAEGNRWTGRRTIEEFALLKAAETAAANNKAGFKIVDANVKALKTTSKWGSSGPHTATVVMTIEIVSGPTVGPKNTRYYGAQEILAVLGPKHLPKD